MSAKGRVLAVGGSDSGGGAGVQADIKAITVLGGYAATAITAVTVQNTLGVQAIEAMSPALVAAQMRAVLDDIGADAIKTGMLGTRRVVEAVGEVIESANLPVVIDPVLAATTGAALLDDDAFEAMLSLVPLAALITPNAPEAARLTGLPVNATDDLRRAGEALLARGAKAALMKGGHLDGQRVTDVLVTAEGERLFTSPRVDSAHTHGTGCTLASACATGLAQGMPLESAVQRAHAFVAQAIRRAPGLGAGNGPLDHGWPLR